MPKWYGVDDAGHVAMFDAEHTVPDARGELRDYDESTDEALDVTLALSRLLRTEVRPVRGVHARIRAGELQMLASPGTIQPYATHVERIVDAVILARFAPPQRGRESGFMPGLRTFGAGESESVSELERAHADGVCEGCAIDLAAEDIDREHLQALGLYVYYCDEQTQLLERVLVPATALSAASIAGLAARCFRYHGEFAQAREIAVRKLLRSAATG